MRTWRPCDNDAYHPFSDDTKRELALRRGFLFAGIALTLFGCVMAALGIALPSWQVAELSEFNAVHEHGIFYDCVRSEIISLERVRAAARLRQLQSTASSSTVNQRQQQTTVSDSGEEYSDYSGTTTVTGHRHNLRNDAPHRRHPGGSVATAAPSLIKVTAQLDTSQHIAMAEEATAGVERCVSKFENGAESATWTMRMAVEEGDPQAREMLLHRFLPQHKAIIFFFVFSLIFALISVAVGACSSCFVPNGVLHVISAAMAMCCSVLGDVIFFVASTRPNNRNIHGATHIYYQHLSYGFCVHALASAVLVAATLCATVAAYILVKREFATNGRRKRFCNADTSSESLECRDDGATSSSLALCCCGSSDNGDGGRGSGAFRRHLRKRKHVPYTCAAATAAYEAMSAAANPSLMTAVSSGGGVNYYGGGSSRMSVASGCDFSAYNGGGGAAVTVSPFPQSMNFYGNPSTATTLGVKICCPLPPTSPLFLPSSSSPHNIVGIPAPPRDIIASTTATGGGSATPLQYSLFHGGTAPHYRLHYFDQPQQTAAMMAQHQQQSSLATTFVTTTTDQQQRSPSPQSLQSVQLRITVPTSGQTGSGVDVKNVEAAPR